MTLYFVPTEGLPFAPGPSEWMEHPEGGVMPISEANRGNFEMPCICGAPLVHSADRDFVLNSWFHCAKCGQVLSPRDDEPMADTPVPEE